MRRTLLGVTVAAVFGAALAFGPGAADARALNRSQAVTFGDIQTLRTDVAFDVETTPAAVVPRTNLADARSYYCTGCNSESAAFQFVFINGDPVAVAARNSATAVQFACNQCQTVAYATQLVIGGSGIQVSPNATTQLNGLKVRIEQAQATLDGEALVAALDGITNDAIAIIQANTTTAALSTFSAATAAPPQIVVHRSVDAKSA